MQVEALANLAAKGSKPHSYSDLRIACFHTGESISRLRLRSEAVQSVYAALDRSLNIIKQQ